MFDSRYYKKRFIYTYNDELALLEMNYSRYEAYVFLTDKENEDNLDIRLINLEEKKLDSNLLVPLKEFLIDNGYENKDFINPFTRTEKIVSELNSINKNNIKTKVKK